MKLIKSPAGSPCGEEKKFSTNTDLFSEKHHRHALSFYWQELANSGLFVFLFAVPVSANLVWQWTMHMDHTLDHQADLPTSVNLLISHQVIC